MSMSIGGNDLGVERGKHGKLNFKKILLIENNHLEDLERMADAMVCFVIVPCDTLYSYKGGCCVVASWF